MEKKLTEKQVVDIIAAEFRGTGAEIGIDSNMDNTMDWDSMVHLSILVGLDTELDGQAASIKKLASCRSVREILDCLNDNRLITTE